MVLTKFSLQEVWVQSLVSELRFRTLQSAAKKKEIKKRNVGWGEGAALSCRAF